MKEFDATELAYKNGYEKGYADGLKKRQGHWIEHDGGLVCSECGHFTDGFLDICTEKGAELAEVVGGDADDPVFCIVHPFFCEKCGADMQKKKRGKRC